MCIRRRFFNIKEPSFLTICDIGNNSNETIWPFKTGKHLIKLKLVFYQKGNMFDRENSTIIEKMTCGCKLKQNLEI